MDGERVVASEYSVGQSSKSSFYFAGGDAFCFADRVPEYRQPDDGAHDGAVEGSQLANGDGRVALATAAAISYGRSFAESARWHRWNFAVDAFASTAGGKFAGGIRWERGSGTGHASAAVHHDLEFCDGNIFRHCSHMEFESRAGVRSIKGSELGDRKSVV